MERNSTGTRSVEHHRVQTTMMSSRSTYFKPFSPSYEYRFITLKAPDLTQNGYWADRKFCGSRLKPVGGLQELANSDQSDRDDGLWCRRTKFFAKKISHRVASGHGDRRIGVNTACDRREKYGDEKFSRHYCELFGPNLCKDCSKHCVQTDALAEYHASNNINNVSVDPFAVFVQWNSNKDFHSVAREESSDDESDIFINELSDNEDIITSENPSPTLQNKESPDIPSTPACDSGINSCCSTRLGHIRSLVNTDSFPRRYKGLSRENTAFSGGSVGRRENRVPSSRESTALGEKGRGNTGSLLKDRTGCGTNTFPSRRFGVHNHLVSCHAKSLAALYSYGYPLKSKKDWVKLPVQPILMDLKLINFTSYDKSFCTLATGVGLGGIDCN